MALVMGSNVCPVPKATIEHKNHLTLGHGCEAKAMDSPAC